MVFLKSTINVGSLDFLALNQFGDLDFLTLDQLVDLIFEGLHLFYQFFLRNKITVHLFSSLEQHFFEFHSQVRNHTLIKGTFNLTLQFINRQLGNLNCFLRISFNCHLQLQLLNAHVKILLTNNTLLFNSSRWLSWHTSRAMILRHNKWLLMHSYSLFETIIAGYPRCSQTVFYWTSNWAYFFCWKHFSDWKHLPDSF